MNFTKAFVRNAYVFSWKEEQLFGICQSIVGSKTCVSLLCTSCKARAHKQVLVWRLQCAAEREACSAGAACFLCLVEMQTAQIPALCAGSFGSLTQGTFFTEWSWWVWEPLGLFTEEAFGSDKVVGSGDWAQCVYWWKSWTSASLRG